MFAGLRHDGIIRSNYQKRNVDANGTGQHILNEPFMPRHIDDAQLEWLQIQMRKTDVDGDSALLFLG